jgi:hypothetical protein
MKKWREAFFLFPLFGVVLLHAPAFAFPAGPSSPPLGVVVSAENPHTGVDRIYAGATVYDGDRLTTVEDGAMRLRLGTGLLLLRQGTAVTVHALPNGFSADLDNGTVSASSPEGKIFQVLVDGITIRPATSQPTSAQVQLVSPTEAILTSARGDLLVSMGDVSKTVSAGNTYKLQIDDEEEASAGPQQGPIPAGKNRHILEIIIIAGVAIGTGIAIWRSVMSPNSPQ